MATSRQADNTRGEPPVGITPAWTPGSLGINDTADPTQMALSGDTPGPLGQNDHGSPPQFYGSLQDSGSKGELSQEPESGTAPIGVGSAGMVAVVRIPVPGTNGLFVELSPRGFVPKSGSTSTLFIQDVTGKRNLRLDYGYNKNTNAVDYHWNQKGTFEKFSIADHTSVGEAGEALYKGAKYLKYGGRVLLVAGAVLDVISIVEARKKVRQALRVAGGWTGAWAGCEAVGAGGAGLGTFVEPGGGTAVGGVVGCFVGSIGGYFGGQWATGKAYDYIEEHYFEPLPETGPPAGDAPARARPPGEEIKAY